MMNYLIAWLASVLPGWKTKIWSATLAGSGALLSLLTYLQTLDLSQYVNDAYLGPVLGVIGMVTYFLRTIVKTVDTPTITVVQTNPQVPA